MARVQAMRLFPPRRMSRDIPQRQRSQWVADPKAAPDPLAPPLPPPTAPRHPQAAPTEASPPWGRLQC
eukprot:scaffold13341_cov101-Isochrysis_galbana.AAC.9